jgi:hypothetical protein
MEQHILVEAKTEYTKNLISIIVPRVREGIYSIFQEALRKCTEDNKIEELLVVFQQYLASIPRWSDHMVEEEYERIVRLSKCDYLDDLITSVFVIHTKILTSIRSKNKNKKIDLTIPKPQNFIHKIYIECARSYWRQPYIFINSTKYSNNFNISKIKQQEDYRESEKIIREAIEETIRKMLPVKEILTTYLGESINEILNEEQSVENDVNHDIVKTLAKQEANKYREEMKQNVDEYENKNKNDEQLSETKNEENNNSKKHNVTRKHRSNSMSQIQTLNISEIEELMKPESEDKTRKLHKENNKSSQKSIETPEEKPDETPEEKPDETPEEKPDETPEEKPDETPEEKPDETPAETPEEKPEEKSQHDIISGFLNQNNNENNEKEKPKININITQPNTNENNEKNNITMNILEKETKTDEENDNIRFEPGIEDNEGKTASLYNEEDDDVDPALSNVKIDNSKTSSIDLDEGSGIGGIEIMSFD